MSEAYQAGKEVLSYCSKCKLTLAHVIEFMKDSTSIGKVKCKTCNATHAYKDPSTVTSKKVKTTSHAKPRVDRSVEDVWLDAMNATKAKSQAYTIATLFRKGDIIDHPTFGPGVVDHIIDVTKVQVIFRHDIKVLVHNKH